MSIEQFISDFEDSMDEVESKSLNQSTVFKELKSWDSLAVLTVTDMIDLNYGVLFRKGDYDLAESLSELYELVIARSQK